MTQEEFSAVCPYLGLADDADSHATYATEAHRCYRLANPTRIAAPHQESYCLGANHVTCPVYLGEGVPGAEQRAPRPQAAVPPPETPTVRGPQGAREAGGTQPFGGGRKAPAAGQRPPRRQGGAGTLGPRPRSGGVSMPVATIGLFALAAIVIVLALVIQQMVGDSGGGDQAPADAVATRDALNRTRTAQAGGDTTPTTQTPGNQTPGTPTAGTPTPGSGTAAPSPTTSTGGTTYTVESGDTCFSIAQDNGITLQELLDANDLTEDDCSSLNVGDELTIP